MSFLDQDKPFNPKKLKTYYGWPMVIVSVLGVMSSIPGQTMGVSVFTDSLIKMSELSRMNISIAYGIGTFVSGFFMGWAGRFYDKHGGRFMTIVSCSILGITLVIFGYLQPIIHALTKLPALSNTVIGFALLIPLFFFLRLSGQGMLTLSSRNVIGKWFSAKKGIVSGICGAFTSLGFSYAPKLLATLIIVYGTTGAYLWLALTCGLGMACFAYVFYRDSPEACGIPLDGTGVKISESEKQKSPQRDVPLAEAKRTWEFWHLIIALCIQGTTITGMTFHIEDLGRNAGKTLEETVMIFLPMSILSILTGTIAGKLSDKHGVKFMMIAISITQALGFYGMTQFSSDIGYWVAVIGLGCSGGLWGTLSNIGVPHYFGRAHLGALSGYLMGKLVVTSAIGPLVFAIVVKYTQSYNWAFLMAIILPVLNGSICFFKAKK